MVMTNTATTPMAICMKVDISVPHIASGRSVAGRFAARHIITVRAIATAAFMVLVAFTVRVARVLIPPDPALKYPACIDGARACPPEDVGGVSGYAEFLEAWRDPNHEDHRHMRQWAGRPFDPARFDLAKSDKAVRSPVRKARKDYIFRRH
jgi:Plasmid pRiA4b ORF-3-like protein